MGRSLKTPIPTQPPVVHVIWYDSYALEETWHPVGSPIERRLIRSIGFQVEENDEYLVLATNYDPTCETYGTAIAIHKPCIVSRVPLTELK